MAINALKWQSLTSAINEMKGPQTFLKNLVFGREITLPTDKIELSYWDRGRKMAPFVRKNGEAVYVDGVQRSFATVEAPNIRIKRPVTPSDIMDERTPGSNIFINSESELRRLINEHVARDMEGLVNDIVNAEEWLAAQALTGTVTYSAGENGDELDEFTITFPIPVANNRDIASASWADEAASAGSGETPAETFKIAKRLMNDAVGLVPSICIMGEGAADLFMEDADVKDKLDRLNYSAGALTIENQYNEQGAIRLGRYAGIECWEYGRSIDIGGTATKLVADGDVIFLPLSQAAEFVTYYGAIYDLDAFGARAFASKRFSKSWMQPDPSVRTLLATSRPLCVPRRPGAIVRCTGVTTA